MPLSAPRYPHVRYHPGSSEQEIADEPEWTGQHDHRIGFLNRQNRVAGLTHDGDHDIYETEEDKRFADDAIRRDQLLKDRTGRGELLNFEDIARGETVGLSRLANFTPTNEMRRIIVSIDQMRIPQDLEV